MNPSALLKTKPTLSFDLDASAEVFRQWPEKNFMIEDFKVKGKPVSVKFSGTPTSKAICATSFSGKSTYSFPLTVDDDVLKLFETLKEVVTTHTPDWFVNNPGEKESFWVRIALDSKTKQFKTKFVPKVSINEIDEYSLEEFTKATVTADLKAWYSLKDERAGVSLNVRKVEFS